MYAGQHILSQEKQREAPAWKLSNETAVDRVSKRRYPTSSLLVLSVFNRIMFLFQLHSKGISNLYEMARNRNYIKQ